MTTCPVSKLLEAELSQEVRRHGIVVWLDKDGTYSNFVDRLKRRTGDNAFQYPVVPFRGSFLEVLFALEEYGSGYDKQALLLHMPGHNEDTIRATPALELYSAGTRFRKGIDTLVRQAATGRVLPGDVEEFLSQKPTLEAADEWLASAAAGRSVGLEALLDASGHLPLVEALAHNDHPLSGRIVDEQDAQVLRNYLHKLTGMDDEWYSFAGGAALQADARPGQRLERVLGALGPWILCVEYVHDLRREPHLSALRRLKDLSAPLIKTCRAMVTQFRKNHADAYAQLADETESMLDSELRLMTPDDLGHVDTFREEENRVLLGAVEALKEQNWPKAAAWCKAREGDKSFWLRRDPVRRRAWKLAAEAAGFGQILSAHPRPFAELRGFEDALTRYAEKAALVDRAHRRFEQEWLRRLDTKMPHFGALQEVLGGLRGLYRTWVDTLARDFTQLCRAEGFLPPTALQQRTLYEQVVQPIAATSEKVAVFMIDAFRYEMATELIDDLRATGAGAVVDLKARYAELPTITSVGMNALPPVSSDGRLMVSGAFKGFKTGEFTVKGPDDRARAMGTRSSGKSGLRLDLSDVCEMSQEALKRKVREHQIIVVCSTELDDAGEANVGLLTFEAQLRQIKAAWHHLQGVGVKHAVFTADHGFLLQDSTTEVRPFGKKSDPSRRHILDEHERGEEGMTPVAVSKLGYDGVSGYLLLREDTAVYATGTVGASFVHGGNSPQERIIPVLTITRKRVETSSLAEYAIDAEKLPDAFGFQRLRLRLGFPPGQTSLGFVGARNIELGLRVPDRQDVRATLKEVSGAGEFKAGRVRTPIGDAWTEVFFALEGPSDDRVRVEVVHEDKIERVRSRVVDALFVVSGVSMGKSSPPPPIHSSAWANDIEDEGIRSVFVHIEKHGAITETEVMDKLGSARAARRFSRYLEEYLTKLPFNIRSESNASGKRYVREEEK